jgi:DNA repair protein RadA/Sms
VALASSLRERPVPLDTLVLGEVGLTGEIRQVADLDSRLREAARHGFTRAVLARTEGSKPRRGKIEGMELMTVTSVEEAVASTLQPPMRRAGRG